MARENRIKIMAKLAILEQEHGCMIGKAKTYYRSDFISVRLIKNAFIFTIAFLIGLLLWSSYRMDSLLEALNTMDIMELAKNILIVYGIAMACYLIVTYIIHYIKFNKAEKKLLSYRLLMDRLIKEYDKEYGDEEVTGHKRNIDGDLRKIR